MEAEEGWQVRIAAGIRRSRAKKKRLQAFGRFISTLTKPLIILNTAGVLIAGAWLVYLGEWHSLVTGLLVSYIASFPLGIILMPGLLFLRFGISLMERGKEISAYFLFFLQSFYTAIVMTVWCLGVLAFYLREAQESSFIPTLMWSYGMAFAPWMVMTREEVETKSNARFGSILVLMLAQAGYVGMLILLVFFQWSLADVAVVFAIVMLGSLGLQFVFAHDMQPLIGTLGENDDDGPEILGAVREGPEEADLQAEEKISALNIYLDEVEAITYRRLLRFDFVQMPDQAQLFEFVKEIFLEEMRSHKPVSFSVVLDFRREVLGANISQRVARLVGTLRSSDERFPQ